MLNRTAISAMVASSFSASRATFALNSAAYRFLFVLLILVTPLSFIVYFTPYTTVRIPGTTSPHLIAPLLGIIGYLPPVMPRGLHPYKHVLQPFLLFDRLYNRGEIIKALSRIVYLGILPQHFPFFVH